jgi:hypothetical protein
MRRPASAPRFLEPLLTLLLLLPAGAGAVEIRTYDLRVTAAVDGTGRAAARIGLVGCVPGPLALPLGLPAAPDLVLTAAPAGTTLVAESVGGQTLLRLTLPEGTPETVDLGLELDASGLLVKPAANAGKGGVPAGRWQLRHGLLASQPETIGRYRFELVFPAGLRAHAVREALPRPRQGEAGPRAALAALDGRPGARLEVDNLAQGETAALQVELVPATRSPAWWIAGLALSLLYLVRFRDLVSKPVA